MLRDTWTRIRAAQWRCYICRSWNPWSRQVCHTCGRQR